MNKKCVKHCLLFAHCDSLIRYFSLKKLFRPYSQIVCSVFHKPQFVKKSDLQTNVKWCELWPMHLSWFATSVNGAQQCVTQMIHLWHICNPNRDPYVIHLKPTALKRLRFFFRLIFHWKFFLIVQIVLKLAFHFPDIVTKSGSNFLVSLCLFCLGHFLDLGLLWLQGPQQLLLLNPEMFPTTQILLKFVSNNSCPQIADRGP